MTVGNIPLITLSSRDYDAVLFDLDGVLTRTARVHASAWKKLFDHFLARHARQAGVAFVPFDIDADYRRYVDGKPHLDGVAAFLDARGIELPEGTPDDGPDVQSVHALGRTKDQYEFVRGTTRVFRLKGGVRRRQRAGRR